MKHKSFGEMHLLEQAEALIAQEMPDGTKIDYDTAIASLSRLIPMLKDNLGHDEAAICLFSEGDKKIKGGSYENWKNHVLYLQGLVNKGEEMILEFQRNFIRSSR